MAQQTRYPYSQTISLGTGTNKWQYKVILYRVKNPFPIGTVPESLQSTTAIPSYIYIDVGHLKKSFDLAKEGDGDKIDNIEFKLMDDPAGTWLRTNIFTNFGYAGGSDLYVYQVAVQCDKGTGTFSTMFFGEIDPRTIKWDVEYKDYNGNFKQCVSFTAVSIFMAALQAIPFGDNSFYYVNYFSGANTTIWGLPNDSLYPSSNRYLAPEPASGQPLLGAMSPVSTTTTTTISGASVTITLASVAGFYVGCAAYNNSIPKNGGFYQVTAINRGASTITLSNGGATITITSGDTIYGFVFAVLPSVNPSPTYNSGTLASPLNKIANGIWWSNIFFWGLGQGFVRDAGHTWGYAAYTGWWCSNPNPTNSADPVNTPRTICDQDDGYFARFSDVITRLLEIISFRMGSGWGVTDQKNNIDFSHLGITYSSETPESGGDFPFGANISPANLPYQIALHRTIMLSAYTFRCTGTGATDWLAFAQPADYSPAKQGSAWDALILLLDSFFSYAKFSFDDTNSLINISVQSPVSSGLSAFIATEPKVSSLNYTPYGFAARSVSGKLLVNSGTSTDPPNGVAIANPTQYPTNDLTYSNSLTQASQDLSIELAIGNFWSGWIENQLAIFADEISGTGAAPGVIGQCVVMADSNANGELRDGSHVLKTYVTINLGFGGTLGTYSGLSLTDAITRSLFSLFCGVTYNKGGSTYTVTSGGLEQVEIEIPYDQYCETTAGGFIDTRNLDTALLQSIPLTTNAQHTFFITNVDIDFFNTVRTAKVTAVRTVS